MEIVWQTPANPPERHDYIFRNGNLFSLQFPLYAVFFLQQTFMPFSALLVQEYAMLSLTTSNSSPMYDY